MSGPRQVVGAAGVVRVGARGSERFPRALRLRRAPDFRRVQGGGRRRTSPHLVVVWLPREGSPRFGLAVSRKVGNAVVRNRVKRWLRESIRRQHAGLTGVDVVFIARQGAASAGWSALRDEVSHHLRSLKDRTP